MGLESMHELYEEDQPVTRRECYLHRQALEQRVGGLESDIKEIKYEQRILKECVDKYFELQSQKWQQLFLIVIVILILVAAGRIFDIDAWLGLVP